MRVEQWVKINEENHFEVKDEFRVVILWHTLFAYYNDFAFAHNETNKQIIKVDKE